jgi:hypothetical protein
LQGRSELLRLAELKARARGELRDREINVTNVQIDGDTAARMAEMFLARRATPQAIASVSAGSTPAASTIATHLTSAI